MGKTHAIALSKLGYELVGGVDSHVSKRKSASRWQEFNGLPIFESTKELLEQTAPDLVCVATTAPSHLQVVTELADGSVPYVLCEKPFSVSVGAAQRMISACDQAGTRLAVNYQSRFLERYRYMREMDGAKNLGAFSSLMVSGSDFGLAMNGSHFIEIFQWLSRARIEYVTADVRPQKGANPRGHQYQDYAGSLLAWSERGHRLFIDAAETTGHGIVLTVNYERGKLVFDEITGKGVQISRLPQDVGEPSTKYGTPASCIDLKFESESLVEGTSLTIEALLRGNEYPTSEEGERVIRSIVAAVESTATGGSRVSIGYLGLDATQDFRWP
jgi:predicted dehydrogenase